MATAAILDFRLPVTTDGIRNSVIEYYRTPKMGVSRSNGVAIFSRSRYISTSGASVAILKYRLPFTSGCIRNSATDFLDLENEGLAAGTALLSCLEAEIYVLPF
jgi:hypothetical protein